VRTAPRVAYIFHKLENYTSTTAVELKQQHVSSPIIYTAIAVIWTLTATSVSLHGRITKKI